jgi:hypothetical protein
LEAADAASSVCQAGYMTVFAERGRKPHNVSLLHMLIGDAPEILSRTHVFACERQKPRQIRSLKPLSGWRFCQKTDILINQTKSVLWSKGILLRMCSFAEKRQNPREIGWLALVKKSVFCRGYTFLSAKDKIRGRRHLNGVAADAAGPKGIRTGYRRMQQVGKISRQDIGKYCRSKRNKRAAEAVLTVREERIWQEQISIQARCHSGMQAERCSSFSRRT